MQTLKFSVCEQSGRTFEIPLDKAKAIIKENAPDAEIDTWNENEIAEELYNFYSDDIAKYERDNYYFETFVQDVEVSED